MFLLNSACRDISIPRSQVNDRAITAGSVANARHNAVITTGLEAAGISSTISNSECRSTSGDQMAAPVTANQQVTLPMPGLSSVKNLNGPLTDRSQIGDAAASLPAQRDRR